jgi:hypothetical protein
MKYLHKVYFIMHSEFDKHSGQLTMTLSWLNFHAHKWGLHALQLYLMVWRIGVF